MDALEWIACREPRPPAALVARMSRALVANPESTGTPIYSELVTAATRILAQNAQISHPIAIGRDDPDSRASDRSAALDLLAADALVTYAMEYATGDCASFDAVAASAMFAISELR